MAKKLYMKKNKCNFGKIMLNIKLMSLKNTAKSVLIFIFCCSFYISKAQVTVTPNQTALALATELAGTGVTVSNATLNCFSAANGKFDLVPPNVTSLGIDSGIVLTSGSALLSSGPAGGPSAANAFPGDPDLNLLVNGSTQDACILEFDFIPLGDTVKFNYVFGSSEYPGFTCNLTYNDVFGFFISGPSISGPFSSPAAFPNGSQNIAIVPGSTTCPVGVSTIYCMNTACCNNAGACFGSTPGCGVFNAVNNTCPYFVCNQAGLTVAYPGHTTVLEAVALTVPCSTHHLKLAIADKGDQILDSGVFLKAGSLTSTSVTLSSLTTLQAPYPYIAEGCAPGLIKVARANPSPLPYVFNYAVGGNAINGVDYAPLSGSVTIPPFDTVAYIVVYGLQDALIEGSETLKIYQYAPCTTNISDSTELIIEDKLIIDILTSDTSICREDSVIIQILGDDSLAYFWTPTLGVSNPNIKNPIIKAQNTTWYYCHAYLPLSGCDTVKDSILITIYEPPNVNLGNDTIICKNMLIQYNPTITPNQVYTYTWSGSGAAFLSNTTIVNPLGTFNQLGTFQLILKVEPQAFGCDGADTITVQVLPDDIILHNNDTTICQGGTVQMNVDGSPFFTYLWTPSLYLNNVNIEDPFSTADSSISYTVTATFPGCPVMQKDIDITVEPVPIIDAGLDRELCLNDTVNLFVKVIPNWFTNYTFTWAPNTDLNSGSIQNPVFTAGQTTLLNVIVNTPIGCADTDQVFVMVHPIEFATITPETSIICPNDSVQLNALGGVNYVWKPKLYLNDSTISNPISKPITSIEYQIHSSSPFGCIDTDIVRINVMPDALLDAGEDKTIYPGESVELHATGNVSQVIWFPPYGLNNPVLLNPIAQPGVTTKYIVSGTTEFGCIAIDSVTVFVSPETLLELPNAFSPGNGSSINDQLKIIKKGLATLNYFRIFNRWGELVFETKDINEGWNGQFNGVPQPIGVYVFSIDAQTSTGKIFNKQGNVTLIR